MDDMPKGTSMERQEDNGLSGLDPAELLKQGAGEDTFTENHPGGFTPPTLEELSEIFPRFEILELIGKGGMGAVYKVRQPELDRIVAMKILPPAIGLSPAFASRFTREAKALAKLSHPGIVTIHESGQEGGLYYILMEYVDGVNLRQLLTNGRISPREAMAIVPQICDALQFAHDQGIVHRDIKPENLLLDRLGRVNVADFGIAKLIGNDDPAATATQTMEATLTDGGKAMGTPQYMAPEQTDSPTEVNHRADIFALGVVFYQMLTGELPEKDLQAPSSKVRIDVRLDEVVLRALEKDPDLRFSNATEMRTGIEGIGNAPMPPELPPALTPLTSPSKTGRNTTFKVLAVLGLLLIAVPIMVVLLFISLRMTSVKTLSGSSRTADPSPPKISDTQRVQIDRYLPKDEMAVIDLAGNGAITTLKDQLFEEAEIPDFGISHHVTINTDGASGKTTGSLHFLNSRAKSFAISSAPTGTLFEKPHPSVIWDVATKDSYGTSSICVNPYKGYWYAYRIALADGRIGYGSFKLSGGDKTLLQWTFVHGTNFPNELYEESDSHREAEFIKRNSPPAITLSALPELVKLAWQDEVKRVVANAWLPSGESYASKDWIPPHPGVNFKPLVTPESKPRYLCLWFAHPDFDRKSVSKISLLQEDAKTPVSFPRGDIATSPIPKSGETGGTGWITHTRCAGTMNSYPAKAIVSLRYSIGRWTFEKEISASFHGTMAIGDDGYVNDPGQDINGNSVIQINWDSDPVEKKMTFDFVAIAKDGRRIESNGQSNSSVGSSFSQRFEFPILLSELRAFHCLKRPIREMSWPVVLRRETGMPGVMMNQPRDPVTAYIELSLKALEAAALHPHHADVRLEAEKELSDFILLHPKFPNQESLELAEKQFNDVRRGYAQKTRKTSEPVRIDTAELEKLKIRLTALEDLTETSRKVLTSSEETVLAKDLPESNRIVIRRTEQEDANAQKMKFTAVDEDGEEHQQEISVSRNAIIWDQHVSEALISGEDENHQIHITLNQTGTRRMAAATRPREKPIRLAIIIDGKIQSAPVVQGGPLGSRFVISGLEKDEAFDL